MTPGEWQEIECVYLAAAELAADDRAAYLDQACAESAKLRAEVESLLAADRKRGRFLDLPPGLVALDLLESQPGTLAPGQLVGGYEVRSLISIGGMGEVYLAEEIASGQPVAVKLLRRHLTVDAHSVERFEREALAAGALRHPNIVAVREFGRSDAGLFLAMEWVDGPTWRAAIDAEVIPLARALDWSRQAAEAIAAAHAADITHRDIKPDNIMVNRAGKVKILDFGLARLSGDAVPDVIATGASGTISGTLSGTLPYMSPELLRGEPASAASDVFSLGSVLYELFTRHHPFAGATPLDVFEAIECRTPERPSLLRRELPASLDRLLLAMLDHERHARPTAEVAAKELLAIAPDA